MMHPTEQQICNIFVEIMATLLYSNFIVKKPMVKTSSQTTNIYSQQLMLRTTQVLSKVQQLMILQNLEFFENILNKIMSYIQLLLYRRMCFV